MTWLENLLLVLLLEVHSVVYIILLDLNSFYLLLLLQGVFVFLNNILHLLLLAITLTGMLVTLRWLHHVRKLFDIIRSKLQCLQRWKVIFLHACNSISFMLLRCELSLMLKHAKLHESVL